MKRLHEVSARVPCTFQVTSALILPSVYSRYGYHFPSFLAVDRWNMLPPACREARCLADFVVHAKLFLGFPVRRSRPVGLP